MRHLIYLLILCLMLTACSLSTSQRETPTSGISLLSTPNTSIIATPQVPTTPHASPTPTLTPTPVPTSKPTVTPTSFASVKVAEETNGIDTNDRHNVEMISHVETVGSAMDVAVAGNYAYVADAEAGLQVVDISVISDLTRHLSPIHHQSRGKLPGLTKLCNSWYFYGTLNRPCYGPERQAYRVVIQDGLAYIAALESWRIVDVSVPLTPKELSRRYEGDDYFWDIVASGNYAYIAAGFDGVQVMDVSNPTAPVAVSTYRPKDEYIQGVTIGGNYLYAAGSGPGLYVLDVVDPLHPIEVSTYTIPSLAWDIEIAGDQAFVVWNLRHTAGGPPRECGSGVTIIDISTPETPVEVGRYCDPSREGASDVAVANNYMYVAAGDRGVRVLDISDPTVPTEVGFYDTPGDARSVAVAGNYVYVADGEGVFILRFMPE